MIADDRSLNGVYVNGQRVREARLRHGDEVRIGDRIMRYLEVTKASKAGLALPSASRSPQS